jgi:hypothetical protein
VCTLYTSFSSPVLTYFASLALCELYLSLSALALRVMPHMRLHETVDADLAYDHDMFIPMTKDDRGVRVAIE